MGVIVPQLADRLRPALRVELPTACDFYNPGTRRNFCIKDHAFVKTPRIRSSDNEESNRTRPDIFSILGTR